MARSRGIDETIGLFRQARRDAVSLWTAKWHLLKAGQEKFSKSSKEFQAIDRLCCWGPAERIRSLADGSACRFADRHGDDVFRAEVDGTQLNAVTKWFYGTLPEPIRDMDFNRIKRFSVSEPVARRCEFASAGVHNERGRTTAHGSEAFAHRSREVEFALRQGPRNCY